MTPFPSPGFHPHAASIANVSSYEDFLCHEPTLSQPYPNKCAAGLLKYVSKRIAESPLEEVVLDSKSPCVSLS